MTDDESRRLDQLIGDRNPVRVFQCVPVPAFMVPSLVRERFRTGTIEMTPDGGMAVHQPNGTLLCVCPNE